MSRCFVSASVESLSPDGLDALPGAYEPRRSPAVVMRSGLLMPPPDDRLPRNHNSLSPVGIGHSLTGLCQPRRPAPPIEELAMPEQPPRSLSRLLSLSGRFVREAVGLRDGDSIRRGRLEEILVQMVADFNEWSRGAKVDGTARIFLIRCRGHLGRIEKLRGEHDFVRNPLGSDAAATTVDLLHDGEVDDFLADVACAKKKVGEWITQAVLETDLSLYEHCKDRLQSFHRQHGTSQQQAAALTLSNFSQGMEKLKYLSEHSKKVLRQEIICLQELLDGR